MAHRSRRALNTNPREDLSKLSSEVLKLRLQALSLPITGSKKHLLSRLKRATQVNAAVPRRKPQKRLSQPKARRGRPAKQTAIETQPSGEAENLPRRRNVPLSPEYEQEDSALSDRASLSSIEEMLESDLEPDIPNVPSFQQDTGFSPVQRSAIEAIVTQSVHSAFSAFRTPPATTPSTFTPGMASPLGLSRPVDKSLEDKIPRGEYIDFALLLPDNLYQSQTPEIQLRLDDSSSGPMGSPVTMVRRKKPVIDTFQSGSTRSWYT